MERYDLSFDEVVSALDSGLAVQLSRWGDGEWAAILGHGTKNCDSQSYTAALRKSLAGVLEARPNYSLAIQRLAMSRFGSEIEEWLAIRGLSDLRWCDAGLFHSASIRGQLESLFCALNRRGVVMVGPERLARLPLRILRHVEVPGQEAFDSYGRWSSEAYDTARKLGSEPVVAVSAGPAANLLIAALARELPECSAIDFGSVWEPYAGHANRTYHRKILERLSSGEQVTA